MKHTSRKRSVRRGTALLAVMTTLAFVLAACGGSTSSDSGGGDSAAYAKTLYPEPDQAVLKDMAAKVLNADVDVDSLAPEYQRALMIASKPMTDEQRKIFQACLSKSTCETGQGQYTLAIVEDQVNTFYSMTRAEVTAHAIKSGAVKKIIHFSSDIDVQKYLADWRSAVGQGADLIVNNYGALGNQSGPGIQLATSKGIPVVNGCCVLAPEVSKLLTAVTDPSICKMWEDGGAEAMKAHLKEKGKDASYAIFTGPAGNPFAASWQPCVKAALKKAGINEVYDGTTDWTPQGTVKAVAALRASGKTPGMIVYDTYAQDFINAYADAGDKDIPTFALTASSDVGTAKAYQDAKAKNIDLDVFVAPSIVWLINAALQVELEIKDGKKPSSRVLEYPMTLTDLGDVIDGMDLDVNSTVFLGNTLEPKDQQEAMKH